MIIGIGTDIVEIARIATLTAQSGARFLARSFTEEEQALARRRGQDDAPCPATLAKRFAAKEACAKALGSGISGGILFREIGVRNNAQNKPELELSGAALARLQAITPAGHTAHLHLSLSDERSHATAFVVVEARTDAP